MRRPIVLLLFAFSGGIFLGREADRLANVPALFILLLAAIFLSLLIGGRILFGRPMAILLSAVFLIGGCYLWWADSLTDPLEVLEGQVVTVKGRIISVQERETGWQMEVRRREGNGQRLVLVRLSDAPGGDGEAKKNPQGLVGKDVALKGRVDLPEGPRNPGGFDYRLYLKTRGIRVILTAYGSHLEVTGKGNSMAGVPARFRARTGEAFSAYMEPETLGLFLGMLFGDRTLLEEDLYEAFQRNGTAHILSVSGIHVGIVYLWIYKLFGGRKSVLSSSVAMLFLLFYAAMASFSPSVVRAVVMIGLHILSGHLYRRYDFLCGAAFAAFLMLLRNPFQLFHTGFQLSFLAVFTLAFLLPPVTEFLGRKTWRGVQGLLAKAGKIAAPIMVIQAGMAPATAYLFHYFSIAAFFANLPVVALAGLILPLGLLTAFLSFVTGTAGEFLFGLFATGTDLLMELMITINDFMYFPGITSFLVPSPPLFLLALYYGIIFFLASEGFWLFLKTGDRQRMATVCCLFVVWSVMIPVVAGEGQGKADLVFVSVGQGDCLHIRTPGGKNILIDGGGSAEYDVGRKVLLPYLLGSRVTKIDLALVTHLHADHFLGLAALCQEGMVKKLGVYEGTALREEEWRSQTGLSKNRILALTAGQRIQVEEGIWIDILYPSAKTPEEYKEERLTEEDENACSLLMKINFHGTTVLMTGDLGIEGEETVLSEIKEGKRADFPFGEGVRSDILKIGHHGSRGSTSDAFLEAVNPGIAIIQVGKKNHFGHPHREIIEKLQERGIIIYRNDLQGAILLDIEKGRVRVRTMNL